MFRTVWASVLAIGMCLGLAACPSDDTSVGEGDGTSSGSGDDGGVTMTTAMTSADTGSGTDMTATMTGMTSMTGGSGTGSTTDVTGSTTGPICGNDMVDGLDECDGTDLDSETCLTLRFDDGDLGCADDCTFDTTNCISFSCGNDAIEGAEVCDGTDLGGSDCVMEGFDAGDLACDPGCGAFDTSSCITFMCGNDMVEGTEVCDGGDLAGQDCMGQAFDGGILGCLADCSDFNTSNCFLIGACVEEDLGSAVGLGVTGGDLTGEDDDIDQSCNSGPSADRLLFWVAPSSGTWQFDTAGSALDTVLSLSRSCDFADEFACNDDIAPVINLQSSIRVFLTAGQPVYIAVGGEGGLEDTWVLSITEVETDGGCCFANGGLGCGDSSCEVGVCTALPECCVSGWDDVCAGVADVFCNICNDTDVCGNNIAEAGEDCDGLDLGMQDCLLLGFDAGTLSCGNDCTAAGCFNYEGGCCASNGSVGCTDDACVDIICPADPFCCATTWDGICATAANTDCAICSDVDVCGNNVTEAGETCDTADTGVEDCVTQGFDGGTLGCLDDCSDFNTDACTNFQGGCCFSNGSPGCTDDTCTMTVCGADPFCCNTTWDGICAGAAGVDCTICTDLDVCGNNVLEAGEDCDGEQAGVETCLTQGFFGGTIGGCQDDCTVDTSGCI